MSKPYSVMKFLKLQKKVQKWRNKKQEADIVVKEHEQKYARFYKKQDDAKEKLAKVESTLRNYALEAYANTQNRKPALGIDIREIRKVYIEGDPIEEYPDEFLLSWCMTHRMFLTIDLVPLRKFLLAFPELGPARTTVVLEPTVALARSFEAADAAEKS